MFVINFSQWASLEKTDRDGETLTSKIFGPFSFGKKIWDVFFFRQIPDVTGFARFSWSLKKIRKTVI